MDFKIFNWLPIQNQIPTFLEKLKDQNNKKTYYFTASEEQQAYSFCFHQASRN